VVASIFNNSLLHTGKWLGSISKNLYFSSTACIVQISISLLKFKSLLTDLSYFPLQSSKLFKIDATAQQ